MRIYVKIIFCALACEIGFEQAAETNLTELILSGIFVDIVRDNALRNLDSDNFLASLKLRNKHGCF
jgi:hypothetical protein